MNNLRRSTKLEYYNSIAPERDKWISRNSYFYQEDAKYMRFLIPKNSSVIEIGCGTGQLLAEVSPSRGVGIDLSPAMINLAGQKFPEYTFLVGDAADPDFLKSLSGPFEYVVISDTIGLFEDCQETLAALRCLCDKNTRIIVSYYGYHWEPVLKLGSMLGKNMPQPNQNWLAPRDISNLLTLAGYEEISWEWRQLLPKKMFGLGPIVNRFIATLPIIRMLCIRNYVIARSVQDLKDENLSASVIIPCRNERDNIEPAVSRLPAFCVDQEIIFVEGYSKDGTYEECLRIKEKYVNKKIHVLRQTGEGKGNAVREGYDAAKGDVLIILDADLTVPPEDIPKFYDAIVEGKGEYINGTRLVYPMEKQAMRFLNLIANKGFSILFSYLLNQRITDTLCGTKVLRRSHYDKIAQNRSYFGDFDPFGDFDLLFGAMKQGLKFVEVPIRYRDRQYGETQISRFRHGFLLLRMVIKAFFKLKAL